MKTTVENIPVELIDPSPFQDRKEFAPGELDALALNIGRTQQAVAALVRPKNGKRYELVHGERRHRACILLSQPHERARLEKIEAADGRGNGLLPPVLTLRCEVATLTDAEVIEAQRSENRQRENLTALEEAAGYQQMLGQKDAAGKALYTRDTLAAKMGKSRSHVYERLRLLKLPKPVHEALVKGEIDASVAGLIGALPVESAVKALLADARRGCSFREIKQEIERDHAKALRGAPFALSDATLDPKAGPCMTCPKRSGNLDPLSSSPDVCMDPACYRRKLASAAKEGDTVIDAKTWDRVKYSGKFEKLGQEIWLGDKYTKVGLLLKQLKDKAPAVQLADGGTEIVEVVDTAALKTALASAGLMKKQRSDPGGRSWQAQQRARAKKKDQCIAVAQAATVTILDKLVAKGVDERLWALLADRVRQLVSIDVAFFVAKRRGLARVIGEARPGLEAWLANKERTNQDRQQFVVEAMLCADWGATWDPKFSNDFKAVCKVAGVNLDKLVAAPAKRAQKGGK